MSAPATLTVAVLAGGRSSEHDVSLVSAEAVRDGPATRAGHAARWVEIDRDGAWRHEGERLSLDPGEGLLEVDVVFPALHGPFGEDGTVQGVLETLDVAYVGAGVAASALCMDKVLFKELMCAAGVPQVDYVGVRAERWHRAPAEVLERARRARPAGVRQAGAPGLLGGDRQGRASRAARRGVGAGVRARPAGDRRGDGERGRGRVRGARAGRTARIGGATALASEPGEIVFAGEWYDYAAKYDGGGMELLVPARISAAARARVRELALEVFAYTGCEGLARVDFFVDGERVLVNELNTMPGFTPTSVYAKLIEAAGIPYPELVDRLCRLGIERWEARRAYQF